MKLYLSPLVHTWLLDLDGTLVKHNGYKVDGKDSWLPGAKKFLARIDQQDVIILLTSRPESVRGQTEDFLRESGVRYDYIIFGLPYGERILINDRKPSGLNMAFAIDKLRDMEPDIEIMIDERAALTQSILMQKLKPVNEFDKY